MDPRGLGQWCPRLLCANPTHKTRLITIYNLGKSKPTYHGTVYQQYLRYIQRHNLSSTPQDLLSDNFVQQVQLWQAAGERLSIFTDMNEHILTGPLAQKLFGLGLTKATHKSWGETPPHTYINGSNPSMQFIIPTN